MGQPVGGGGLGGKPGRAPNPNYGTTGGVDNSNGVYNAGVQSGSQTAYATPGGATGTLESPINAYGTTGATGANYTAQTSATTAAGLQGALPNTPGQAGATGATQAGYTNAVKAPGNSKAGQPPASGYPTANNSMTADAALAANPRPPAYSSYDGQLHPIGVTGTTGAGGLPPGISGLVNSKMQGKGAQPPGMGGTGAAGATGSTTAAGATGGTGAPIDYAAQSGRFNAQNDPTGFYAKYYNNQQAMKAEAAAAPDWMKKALAGSDMGGGTLQQRAESEQKYGADTGATTKDWKSIVNKMSGGKDPYKALSDIYEMAKKQGGGAGGAGQANVHRALMANGIDPSIANRLHEMFASGTDQQGAARRLGLEQEFLKFKGASQGQMDQATELANWHAANRTAGATGAVQGPPGSTGPMFTGPPPGATGSTGGQTGVAATGSAGTDGSGLIDLNNGAAGAGATGANVLPTGGGVVTPEESKATPGLTTERVQQIARQYGVTPEIAKQLWQQILMQSQSSGGGGGPGGSGGDGGDGGGDE